MASRPAWEFRIRARERRRVGDACQPQARSSWMTTPATALSLIAGVDALFCNASRNGSAHVSTLSASRDAQRRGRGAGSVCCRMPTSAMVRIVLQKSFCVTQAASQGLSQNEIGCARISMMARSTNAPCKGRIQMRKTNPLHFFTFGLQRTAGPYIGSNSELR